MPRNSSANKKKKATVRAAGVTVSVATPRPPSARKKKTSRTRAARSLGSADTIQLRPTHATRGFRSTGIPAFDTYLLCLRDPFVCPPIRLGWGCYMPSSLKTCFKRVLGWTPANSGGLSAFVIASDLASPSGAAASFAGAGKYVAYASNADSSTLLSAYSGISGLSAANLAQLDNSVSTFRNVAAAIRIVVRYPIGSTRGSLCGGLYRCTGTELGNQSADTLCSLAQTKVGTSTTAGEMVMDISWRPANPDDFNFYALAAVPSSASSRTQAAFIGKGWPASTTIDIYVLSHIETMAGVDNGDPDYVDGPVLSDESVNQDAAARAAVRMEPVTTSELLVNAIDSANQAVDRSMRGGGWMTQNGFGGGSSAFVPSRVAQPAPSQAASSSSTPLSYEQDYELNAVRRPRF